MIYYYLYMGLLSVAVLLWIVIALREDTPNTPPEDDQTPPPPSV